MRKKYFDKRKRFLELAENRTNKVIRSIHRLSNCSNKYLYKYKKGEVERMFKVIGEEIIKAKNSFIVVRKPEFKI